MSGEGSNEQAVAMIRLLIVEDDAERIDLFRAWLPEDVRLVVASSAGRAIGVLRRDRGTVYAGILLDHDLQMQAIDTAADGELSGRQVVDTLIECINRDVPILVHSMNRGGARVMVRKLESAGFDVTRLPMADLGRADLLDWLDLVQENWRYIGGD